MKNASIVRCVVTADVYYPEQFNGKGGGHGGGGDGGGGVNDQLEKRVASVESAIFSMKNDLSILSERSVNFATSLNCQEIRTELATLNANIAGCATKSELHKGIRGQTTWFVGLLAGIAGLTLSIAVFIFK